MSARVVLLNDGRIARVIYEFRVVPGRIQFVLTCSSSSSPSRIRIRIRITVVGRTTRVLSSRQALRTRPSCSPPRVYSVFEKNRILKRTSKKRMCWNVFLGTINRFFLCFVTVLFLRFFIARIYTRISGPDNVHDLTGRGCIMLLVKKH